MELKKIVRRNNNDASIAPVEFLLEGDSEPVLLALSITPGGYGGPDFMRDEIIEGGIRFLGASRPGYLRTSLELGRTSIEPAGDSI